MTGCKSPPGLMRRLLLFFPLAFLVGATAHAAVPVIDYVVVQPIDVCSSSGTGCAPFNTLSQTGSPGTATLTTPIGFVDTTTNTNLTRAIWNQAGIDVTFLPIKQYNSSANAGSYTTSTGAVVNWTTDYRTLHVGCGTGAGAICTSPDLKTLAQGQPNGFPSTLPPLAPAAVNAINMFFVNSLVPLDNATTPSPIYGFSFINGNGIAIARNTFFPGFPLTPRLDTLAHEIGHNLALGHTDYGAGSPCLSVLSPSGCNVMDGGDLRVVPSSTGCSATTFPFGLLYDLDDGLCSTAPSVQQADQLLVGAGLQAGVALSSGFMNPIPNVNATAGGGTSDAPVAAATMAPSAPNSGTLFTIADNGGGRDAQGEFVNNVVLAFAPGLDIAGNNAVQYVSGPLIIQVIKLNGNNGENPNCQKRQGLSPPSIHCVEIVYQAGKLVPGQVSQFTVQVVQNDQPLTDINQLDGTEFSVELETDQPNTTPGTAPIALFATTSIFELNSDGFLEPANSQFPTASVPAVILNPGTFQGAILPGATTQTPCIPDEVGGSCPPADGGDPGAPPGPGPGID